MTLIDGLLGEHAAIYRLFDRLEQDLEKIETPAELQARLLMLVAALGPHADAEDRLLFAAVAALPGETPPLLADMEAEHLKLKDALGKLLAQPDLTQARAVIPDLLAAARAHFRKEEERGFPLALALLDQATLADLTQQWAALRGVKLA